MLRKDSGERVDCKVVAIAKHETEVDELSKNGCSFLQFIPRGWRGACKRGSKSIELEKSVIICFYLLQY